MKNLFKSLANFQQSVKPINKTSQGFGYKFADLPSILEVINPLLKENGLGFTQLLDGKSIKTIVFHIASGETIESVTDIPQNVSLAKMNEFQVLGSAITYIRRYALSSALGLVTEEDNDASGKQVSKPQTDDKKWLNDKDKEWFGAISKNTPLKLLRKYFNISEENAEKYEKQLKKGDNIILAAFGAGFTWGSTYLKWAYDTE